MMLLKIIEAFFLFQKMTEAQKKNNTSLLNLKEAVTVFLSSNDMGGDTILLRPITVKKT